MLAGASVLERRTPPAFAPEFKPSSGEYRPALDGLRALSVAAVLAFHLDRLPGGNLGVDAFFVISGWLITWKLLDESARRTTVDLRRFWAGRARRLMPASLCVLLAVTLVWPLVGIQVPSLGRDVRWAALWSSNWGTITGGGDYWARFGDPSPITHFWSLAIEEQFYLVWPLVIALFVRRRASRRTLCMASVVLAAISIGVMITMADPANPTATYMNTFARAHSLLIGAAAAAFTVRLPNGSLRGARTARRLLPVAASAVVTLVLVSSRSSQWLFQWGFPAFALAMVVVVVAAADGAGTRVLASPLLRWISDRSYGLYLWHWPVFLLLTPARTGLGGITLDVARVCVAVAIADTSYRWLESPIRHGRLRAQRWLPVVAVATLVGVLVGATLVAPGPRAAASTVVALPAAPVTPSVAESTIATVVASTAPADRVASMAPVPPTTPALPVRVLVTGDSTAQKLAEALVPFSVDHAGELAAGSAAFPGCGLSAAADGRMHSFTNERGEHELVDLSGCLLQWDGVAARVQGPEHIHVVLVDIGPWDGVDIHLADGRVVSVADPVGRQLVVDSYTAFVDSVRAAGAEILWIAPPDIELQWGAVDDPMNDPARWAALRSIIDTLPVHQIDLAAWLTAQGLDGPVGRPDGVHLAPEVNERFMREVVVPALLAL
jgi:peptidoglycan/LPS O-acetylase OafA/YrhL